MKYVIVLGDGMADEPIEAIGGMTPLEYAKTPEMDRLAKMSELGMVQTIPEGMSPGQAIRQILPCLATIRKFIIQAVHRLKL